MFGKGRYQAVVRGEPITGAFAAPQEEPPAPRPHPRAEKKWIPQKPEFLELARRLRASSNPYVGTAQIADLRHTLEAARDVPLNIMLETHIRLALELLKQGELDEALEAAEAAISLAKSKDVLAEFPFLYRARALAHLRRAEVENCVVRHNDQCCLFPLEGGGVHTNPIPARLAKNDYLTYLKSFPHDLGARWLLNLTSMALGEWSTKSRNSS